MILHQKKQADIQLIKSDRQIKKLYLPHISQEKVKYEYMAGCEAYTKGLTEIKPIRLVEEQNRHGILFPLIEGKTLSQTMLQSPWKITFYAKKLAQLHFNIHKATSTKLEVQNQFLNLRLWRLDPRLKDHVALFEKILQDIGQGYKSVCHGDFTPDNIIVGTNGKHITIDWSEAHVGNPFYDVARTSLVLRSPSIYYSQPALKKTLIKTATSFLSNLYLKHYFKYSAGPPRNFNKLVVLAKAIRSTENIPSEKIWLNTSLINTIKNI